MKHILNFNNFINEASFNDFNEENILTDKYIKNIIHSHDGIQNIMYEYISSEGLDEDDSDAIKDSEEFFQYIKQGLQIKLEDLWYDINERIDKYGYIEIYRAMSVDDNWIEHLQKQGKRLGIYWSWDINRAEAHWGFNHQKEVILTAIINEKYINWKETFELNLDLSLADEKEIRLYKNTPLEITNINIDGEDLDIDILKNKTFYA